METNNMAAMRDALEKIWNEAHKQHWFDNGIDLIWLQDVAHRALAAPARNCDRFANAVEAMAEMKRAHSYCAKENRRCLEDCPDCGKEWCSLAWLFAPATEKEEGAK